MIRHFHIWYYGQPHAEATPFSTYDAAYAELARQLDDAARNGEYPSAVIVSIARHNHKDVQRVSKIYITANVEHAEVL